MNGVDVNNIISLADINHVLVFVEAALGDSGSEKSPAEVLETARKCARYVF